MNITSIGDCILDETSSSEDLRKALNAFSLMCSDITGIEPDTSFDAWAEDSLLDSGVAINPQAAAQCVLDYHRSVVFIRSVHAALVALKARFPNTPLEVLYAGCGPYATLVIPILNRFSPGELKLNLLDVHEESLDSVKALLTPFELDDHWIEQIQGDACEYKHNKRLHLVIAETMQKALEQEPQFAITANLAPQLHTDGVFIPQRIEVSLQLADLQYEKQLIEDSPLSDTNALTKRTDRYPLASVCTLSPESAAQEMQGAQYNTETKKLELEPRIVEIPPVADVARLDAALFTRIDVFEQYRLEDYESEITLPLRCPELAASVGGDRYRISYQPGRYPKFNFERLQKKQSHHE